MRRDRCASLRRVQHVCNSVGRLTDTRTIRLAAAVCSKWSVGRGGGSAAAAAAWGGGRSLSVSLGLAYFPVPSGRRPMCAVGRQPPEGDACSVTGLYRRRRRTDGRAGRAAAGPDPPPPPPTCCLAGPSHSFPSLLQSCARGQTPGSPPPPPPPLGSRLRIGNQKFGIPRKYPEVAVWPRIMDSAARYFVPCRRPSLFRFSPATRQKLAKATL